MFQNKDSGRIAIVVSTVGYHWEELFDAYWAFREAQLEVDLFTVNGAKACVDPLSIKPTGPGALFGLGRPFAIAPQSKRGQQLLVALEKVQPLSNLRPESVDAIYLPGGHGCLFDVNTDAGLHRVIAQLFEMGCLLSGVCHATSTFALTRKQGRSIAEGHALTGFPHALDKVLIPLGLVDRKFLPLPLINDEELKRNGVRHSAMDETVAMMNPRHMKVSLPFITGVGPKAADLVAKAVVKALAERAASKQKPSTAKRA